MKILHTADWHLGKKLNGYSRHGEQEKVLDEVVALACEHAADLVLIAGDLFDGPNPPTESIELFYRTLHRLTRNGRCAVLAIAGNHDSPERIEAPEPLALANGIILAGFPDTQVPFFETEAGIRVLHSEAGAITLQLPGVSHPVRILFTPFANELRLRKAFGQEEEARALVEILSSRWEEQASRLFDNLGVNLLVTHLYLVPASGEREAESDDERSIEGLGGTEALPTGILPAGLHYAALGHIHKPWTVQRKPFPVRYSSSPLSYSLSEAGQTKEVILIGAEPGKPVSMEAIPLRSGYPLYRKSFASVNEALIWLEANPDNWVEVTVETDTYLTREEFRNLQQAHPRIADLIPKMRRSSGQLSAGGDFVPDPELDKESLFTSFFVQKKGLPPSEEVLSLFREIIRG